MRIWQESGAHESSRDSLIIWLESVPRKLYNLKIFYNMSKSFISFLAHGYGSYDYEYDCAEKNVFDNICRTGEEHGIITESCYCNKNFCNSATTIGFNFISSVFCLFLISVLRLV